jgi:type IV pilus assembly protein PilW
MGHNGINAMKILSNRHGFTLVELMIALAMSGIIATAMYSAYTGLQRINHDQALIVEMQQNLRAGIDMMARELRMAGYDPDKNKGTGFTEATSTSVAFTQFDEKTNSIKTTKYEFNNGTMDVRRKVDAGNWIVLIENVNELEFLYTLSVIDPATGLPMVVLAPTATQLSQIRSVQISVLARASGISLNYQNNETYKSASGEDWGPYNDDYIRRHSRSRLQIVRVNCRNMGW